MTARRLNTYSCACGRRLLSEDVDDGVTPGMMPCFCGGAMRSAFYQIDPAHVRDRADIEWYKPSPEQASRLVSAMLNHVNRGGLVMRVVTPTASYLPELAQFFQEDAPQEAHGGVR